MPSNPELRRFIVDHFNDAELTILIADYFELYQTHEKPGLAMASRAQELIGYCKRTEQLPHLEAALQEKHPRLYAEAFGAGWTTSKSELSMATLTADPPHLGANGRPAPSLRSRARKPARRRTVPAGDTSPAALTVDDIPMCYVPPGEFIMGGVGAYDCKPEHLQQIKDGFWIGRYPITNAQYAQFVGDGGYARKEFWAEAIAAKRWKGGRFLGWRDEWRGGPYEYQEPFGLANHPRVGVSWYEALGFARWLGQRLRQGSGLPTEAQREYAARGPRHAPKAMTPLIRAARALAAVSRQEMQDFDSEIKQSKPSAENRRSYPWGDLPDPKKMNFAKTGVGATSAVGAFPAGASMFGCEDMSGNVWEWTMTKKTDDYKDYDRKADNRPDGSKSPRVLRGGAFINDGYFARCAYRVGLDPSSVNLNVGFRVVAYPVRL